MKTLIVSIWILGFLMMSVSVSGMNVRQVRDDIGFCWDKDNFNRIMEYLKSTDPEAGKDTDSFPTLIAGISPHDDYLYAGPVYYQLFKHLKNLKEVVIFGVTHKPAREKIGDPQGKLIFDNYPAWRGPFKPVEVSELRDFSIDSLHPDIQLIDNEAHDMEHSIEALIPFLQYFNPKVEIIPIMITGMDYDNMADLASQLAFCIVSHMKEKNLALGKDIFFLISADANHYGPDFNNTVYGDDEKAHQTAIDRDKKIADTYLAGAMSPDKVKGLTGELWGKTYKDFKDSYWCGKYSIPFGLLTVMQVLKQLEINTPITGQILKFSDTYSDGVLPLKKPGCGITAPFSLKHWVDFLSAGYYFED
ncbi:MAG: AmmeMemoRadiSam system protein B [Candidatus Omnitrophota bacterium]